MAELHDVKPQGAPAPAPAPERDRPIPVRLILLGLLALYLLLFVILNSDSVTVNFVFFKTRISLIVGFVLTMVLGFVGGYIVNELRTRRKRRLPAS